MKKFIFIKNAFILTGTSLFLRAVGMFFRVYISNKIGAEGMGLYQLIFSIFILAATFATAGISITVTRLVTEEMVKGSKKTVTKTLNTSLLISMILGVSAAIAVYCSADMIATLWLKDLRALPSLKIMAISLPFMSIYSCLHGYFVARRRISSATNAQILEQFIRIIITVILLKTFLPRGMTYACVAVIIGNVVSEIASCTWMYISYLVDKRKIKNTSLETIPSRPVCSRFMSIALPIAATNYLNSFLRTIENLLVPDNLTKYNASREKSLEEFGLLKGMAMPILFFPSAFLSALSTLLLPEISEAYAAKQNVKLNRTVNGAIYFTIVLSVLVSGFFTLFSKELGMLIYKSEEVGLLIKVFAPIMPLMYLESIVDGILKGLNQQVSTFKYSVIDSVLRIALIIIVVPFYGMAGFLVIMISSNVFTSFLNMRRLLNVTKIKLNWFKWIVKPLIAVVATGIIIAMLFSKMSQTGYVVLGTICGSIIYFIILFLIGGITKSDLSIISKKKETT